MTIRYEVTSQLDGLPRYAYSFEEAKQLQKELLDLYIQSVIGCFAISVAVQNEDGSWTYALADENGLPLVIDDEPQEDTLSE